MKQQLRVLLIEDSERDGALLALHLKRGGYDAAIQRVETLAAMQAALDSDEPLDVVICDYNLPQFNAPDALETLKRTGRDLPFIVVSGSVGEEIAVGMMKSGAHDYLTKDKLARLVPAIEREIQDARERSAKRRAETLFEAILHSSPAPTAVLDRETLQIVDASDSFRALAGESDPRGAKLFDVLHISHPERIAGLVERRHGTAWYIVYEQQGQTRVANARVHTVDHQGSSYACLVLEDVTEQHYLKAAFDAAPNAVMIVSSQNTVLYANRVAEGLFDELVMGRDVGPLLDFPELGKEWWTRPTPRYEEYRFKLNEKPYEAATVAFRFAGHESQSIILTIRSLEQEEELLQLATHDALTGLHNLRYFTEITAQRLEQRANSAMSFAIIDLDYFKPINDELGHAAGDAALITFAALVRAELRTADVFARIGGDEFAVFFPEQTTADAAQTAQRIYDRLRKTPFTFENSVRMFSASMGITECREGDTYETIKARADRALYEAKHAGRGRFIVTADARDGTDVPVAQLPAFADRATTTR